MPPKKSAAAAKSKAAAGHSSYLDMIKMAIVNLKDRKGSSRQAIKKYILANNKLAGTSDAQFNSHINRALTTGEETGVFERPKGQSDRRDPSMGRVSRLALTDKPRPVWSRQAEEARHCCQACDIQARGEARLQARC